MPKVSQRNSTTRAGGSKGGSRPARAKTDTTRKSAGTLRSGGSKSGGRARRGGDSVSVRSGGNKGGGRRPVLNPPERHVPSRTSELWSAPTVRRGGNKGGK
ncbi:MAG: hypothetical protein HYZ28_19610 [Myxococcales bacterium]|nr:hypothetical protein [Myxococcales bacterium]